MCEISARLTPLAPVCDDSCEHEEVKSVAYSIHMAPTNSTALTHGDLAASHAEACQNKLRLTFIFWHKHMWPAFRRSDCKVPIAGRKLKRSRLAFGCVLMV